MVRNISRLEIITPNRAQTTIEKLYHDLERRIIANLPNLCLADLVVSSLKICRAQTCGKYAPRRIGLAQLEHLLEDMLDQKVTVETIDLIERTAPIIMQPADCAIGYETTDIVLKGVRGSRKDYMEHVATGRYTCSLNQSVPRVALCPAGMDIPGYIALVHVSRYVDAVQLTRKDSPFPTACVFVCGHPREACCRRNMTDASTNIRGIKRYAVDRAGKVSALVCAPVTGRQVATTGAGLDELNTAYYLSLMGHSVTVYERQPHLGGMLRYDVPSYRLPRERLWDDIEAILSIGIQVKTGANVGKDIEIPDLMGAYDVAYTMIGAHSDRKIDIPGENSRGVLPAVDMLRVIGNSIKSGFTGKTAVVIGGGNIAMDAVRPVMCLGAEKVAIVYRRREEDMTALSEEVQGVANEGYRILHLQVPSWIEAAEDGDAAAPWVRPRIIGNMDSAGRSEPVDTGMEERRIPCGLIVSVIGQSVEYGPLTEYGVPVSRRDTITQSCTRVDNIPNLFAGGSCVNGPATVIKVVTAGKVAAVNIDNFLGYHHKITTNVVIPPVNMDDRAPCGRVNLTERESDEWKNDFDLVESGMTDQEAAQESSRCLCCDHFGYGVFKGERTYRW